MKHNSNIVAQNVKAMGAGEVFLHQLPLFQSLDEKSLHAVWRASTRHTYACRQVVDVADTNVGIVLAGAVRLYRLTGRGAEITVMRLETGDVFGLRPRGEGTGEGFLQEAKREGTEVLHLLRDTFSRLLDTHPAMGRYLVAQGIDRFGELWQRFEDRSSHSVRERVARELAREAQENEQRWVDVTQEEMARRIGTHVTKVSREVAFFRRQGLVASPRHRPGIEVLEVEQLATFDDHRE